MAEENVRTGSAPNFAPPTEEGITLVLEDEKGDEVELEFLGLIIHNDRRYAFFYPIDEDDQDGELLLLEVVDVDEDGQPSEFELVLDEAIAEEVFADFQEATKDLYTFE